MGSSHAADQKRFNRKTQTSSEPWKAWNISADHCEVGEGHEIMPKELFVKSLSDTAPF